MNRIAIVSLALLLVGVVGFAEEKKGTKEIETKKPKTVTVPFELLASGHMSVKVKVNGKGPFELIFDTGAPMTLVNNKLAKEAKLLDGQDKPLFSLFGASSEPVKIEELSIGEAKVSGTTAMVMDHPTVDALAQALKKPIHGLVGFPFFAQFRMTLDYKAKTMTLTPNGYKPVDVMREMQQMILSGVPVKTLVPAAQWGLVCGKEKNDEEDGVDVKGLLPGGAAEKAGLKKGDRLLTIDGRWTDSIADLYEAVEKVKADTKVKVKVKRDGKEVVLTVTPAKGL